MATSPEKSTFLDIFLKVDYISRKFEKVTVAGQAGCRSVDRASVLSNQPG